MLHCGDCLAVLPTLAENSIDACVTDPPYHLTNNSVGNRSPNPGQYTPIGRPKEPKGGFMGKQWDGGDIAFCSEVWREVYRVLKPGAHLLAFGGTRTYHRMACAIEDAGFEIRDTIMWVYGSGFPKSHNVGNGWGTALKPACEPIVLARKPLSESTVAANVLRWGTGAINVDGCRIATDELLDGGGEIDKSDYSTVTLPSIPVRGRTGGRWPANVIHDGSEQVLAGFPETQSGEFTQRKTTIGGDNGSAWNAVPTDYQVTGCTGGDSGSAARFFYTAKADSDDRLGSKHPTVKPLDLMQYLVRLICPHGGTVLDMFAGTGTTGEAAFREGMSAVLIERESEYQADIRRRMALVLSGPDERAREAAKERMKDRPRDDGPLFSGRMEWDEMWARPFDYPERL